MVKYCGKTTCVLKLEETWSISNYSHLFFTFYWQILTFLLTYSAKSSGCLGLWETCFQIMEDWNPCCVPPPRWGKHNCFEKKIAPSPYCMQYYKYNSWIINDEWFNCSLSRLEAKMSKLGGKKEVTAGLWFLIFDYLIIYRLFHNLLFRRPVWSLSQKWLLSRLLWMITQTQNLWVSLSIMYLHYI